MAEKRTCWNCNRYLQTYELACLRCSSGASDGRTNQLCEGVAGELPKPTIGKLTAHIRALQASASKTPRFYIDHNVIHDRLTGRHIHGDRDVEPGVADEAVEMLNDLHARALSATPPATELERPTQAPEKS